MTATSNWLSGVPSRWGAVRTKFLFNREQRAVGDSDEIVTAFRDGQVTLRRNRRTEGFTNSVKEIGYQGIRSGDLVVHAMDAFAGAIGISDSDGKATPVYSVCTPFRADVFAPYYARLLRHMALTGFVESLSKGVRERSTEFRWAELAEVELPVPPKSEQESIANFLDEQTARIDALIAEKERLNALLSEQRSAFITAALAGEGVPGLDSNASRSWPIQRMRYVAELNPGVRGDLLAAPDTSVSFLPMESIGEQGTLQLDKFRPVSEVRNGYSYFENGDVVFAKVTPCFENGKGAVMRDLAYGAGFGTTEVTVLRPRSNTNAQFLYYVLATYQFRKQGVAHMTGAGGLKRVPDDYVRDYSLPWPSVGEQVLIAEYLDKKTAEIEALHHHVSTHIERLCEYRSSLISAAVTGQLDINSYKETT